MSRPWEIPASALLDPRWNAALDPRWNAALDLAAEVPVSPSKVAAAWDAHGPDRVLAKLRTMAAGSGTKEAA